MKVCLDAGHGKATPGKRTPKFEGGRFIHEAEQNYPVMFKVAEYLRYNGIEVVLTNSDITYDMPLKERVKVANESKADIFVSIHANASIGHWQKYAKGVETYVHKKGYNAEKLANHLQDNLLKDTGMYDRKVKEWSKLYVTKYTKMSAALVELGFMDYLNEAKRMKDMSWHDTYARAITKGICDYFNIKPKFPQEINELEKATLKIKELEKSNSDLTKEVFTRDEKIKNIKALAKEIGEM